MVNKKKVNTDNVIERYKHETGYFEIVKRAVYSDSTPRAFKLKDQFYIRIKIRNGKVIDYNHGFNTLAAARKNYAAHCKFFGVPPLRKSPF